MREREWVCVYGYMCTVAVHCLYIVIVFKTFGVVLIKDGLRLFTAFIWMWTMRERERGENRNRCKGKRERERKKELRGILWCHEELPLGPFPRMRH